MDDEDRLQEWHRLADELNAAQDVDAKTAALSSIHNQLQETSATTSSSDVAVFIQPLKTCLKSSNLHLFSPALALVPLVARLLDTSHDGSRHVQTAIIHLTPASLERAGDARERIRDSALKGLVELGKVALVVTPPGLASSRTSSSDTPLGTFESLITENGLGAKSPKIREQSCRLLASLRSYSTKFPIKPFLPTLVDLLGDADSACREASRATLVALFLSASAAAKADLKREMEAKGVRKPLAEGILRDVIGGQADASPLSHPEQPTTSSKTAVPASTSTAASIPAATASPVYLASRGDLERTVASILPFFDGKETEHNWAKRESSIAKLRGILKSQPSQALAEAFGHETRILAEGILKAISSLRTTLALHGIALVAEMAETSHVPTAMPESAVDILLPGLLRMAGFTKRIVATASQTAAGAMLRHVPYRSKVMGWLAAGMADKTVHTRVAMVEHLGTLLSVAAHPENRSVCSPGALESHDGVNVMSTLLAKGLTDQNKDVRANAREAFYTFRRIWKREGEAMLERLEAGVRKQVVAGMGAADAAYAASQASRSAASPQKAAAAQGAAPSSQLTSPATAAAAPSSKFVPSRKPGAGGATGGPGPSSAIVAAKRAAAARMAEMRRQEAEAKRAEEEEEAAAAAAAAPEEGDETQKAGDEAEEKRGDASFESAGNSTRHSDDDDGEATPTETSPQRMTRQAQSSSSTRDSGGTRADGGVGTSRFWTRDDAGDDDDTVQLGGGASSGRSRRGMNEDGGEDESADVDASITMDLMAPMATPLTGRSGARTEIAQKQAPRSNGSLPSSFQGTRESIFARGNNDSTPRTASSRLPRPASMVASPAARQQPMDVIGALQDKSAAASATAATVTSPKTPSTNAASKGQGWFLNRAARLSLSDEGRAASPLKSKPDSLAWVEEVKQRRADVKTFRQLAKLSSNFKVVAAESAGQGDGESEGKGGLGMSLGSRAGIGRAGGKERLQDEVNDSQDDDGSDSNGLSALEKQQTEAWREGHLFELLFSACETWFTSPPSNESSNAAAQVLLHRLVENQFPLFPALGLEGRLVKIGLFELGGPGGPSSANTAAAKAVLEAWATRTVPAVGLGLLRSEGQAAFEDGGQGNARLLILNTLTHLYSRLPSSVILEDELPRASSWVMSALNDRGNVALRQESVKVLVAAVRGDGGVKGEEGEEVVGEKLQKALGECGLKRDQLDLVLYYVAKGDAS
ncbi:hypothetical protein BDZ90DRAFT_281172 [Jaminaea rosea]|uniref:TOG domain-containing protein n=1 Tax=Jaminaea rosea TaxID=1569628 RepID=A0A316ULU8_9BASI|nr:hypothetical protein BDZ90DRAFT_281172 [Jaminaea rosea]PWN25778.1 hypothetical protein BDZ90DRAFT_281172 [Jaminaea rosea]